MQRRQTVGLDEAEPVRPTKDRPDDSAVRGELSEQLGHAMAQLPYEQREVIVLHLQSKMKFRQIARVTGYLCQHGYESISIWIGQAAFNFRW